MRKFSSYGPVSKKSEYYVPRAKLVETAYNNLTGEKEDEEGGHYFTVWASRQAGKTWILRDVFWRIQNEKKYYTAKVNLETMKECRDIKRVLFYIIKKINSLTDLTMPLPENMDDFEYLFTSKYLKKPIILIFDEFDALDENIISLLVGSFRNIYVNRKEKQSNQNNNYLLHGVALIGVRAALGVESKKGSPFNVQRSMHIPNLTFDEVNEMYHWYEKESGQKIDQAVIDRIFYVTNGQPGLVSWFGELLTETFNEEKSKPLTMVNFNDIYMTALQALPNNNIINIISKAKTEPHKQKVLEIFRTKEKTEFKFEDPDMNFLYMNGVIDMEKTENGFFVKFPSPFVQEKLFNYFAAEIFKTTGDLLTDPFMDLEEYVNEKEINIKNVMRLYQEYLQKNKGWLFKEAPRRNDLRLYEAVYHFNLYMYLNRFFERKKALIHPEFPTGNGKIDLIIKHAGKTYGLELKSFTDISDLKGYNSQAARYGKSLELKEISLIIFVDFIDDKNRNKFEIDLKDEETGVLVKRVFICTSEE